MSSFGGWAAWSRWEAATSAFRLVVRDPAGVVTVENVPSRARQFDVELGPLASGGVAAVYSRCARVAAYKGCHLVELPLQAAAPVEQVLNVPGGGSDFSPALWKGRIAFLRASPGADLLPQESEEDQSGCGPQQQLLEWQIGSRRTQSLKLPVTHYPPSELPELRAYNNCAGRITTLTLAGERVAYVLVLPAGDVISLAELFTQRPGKRAYAVARIGSGGGDADGLRWFLSPVLSGGWLYAYRQFSEEGNSWVRYKLGTKTVQQADVNFEESERHAVQAVEPLGEGAIWSRQDIEEDGEEPESTGRIMLVPRVTWTPLRARNARSAGATSSVTPAFARR